MSALKPRHWKLLAALADGGEQHVFELGRQLGSKPAQMNAFWQQMPAHIRGLLRQHDGQWRLVRPLAVFDEQRLKQLAAGHGFQTALKHECPSSNDVVLDAAKQQPQQAHRLLVVAHQQSKGRGRQGKSWHNRLGECLMFSFGWAFDKPQHELGVLAAVAALACHRALTRLGVAVQIKWPNDLVVGQEKLGGILIETVRSGGKTVAVVGIGINFVLPKDVEQAVSVQTVAGAPAGITASALMDALLAEAAAVFKQFEQGGFAPMLDEYRQANRDIGHAVRLLHHGEVVAEGVMCGITEQGALRLQTADGEKVVVSGEISLRPQPPLPAETHRTQQVLLLDGGNSQLKWAWMEQGRISEVGRAPYRDLAKLGQAWHSRGVETAKIIGCAVCGEAKKALVAAQLSQPIEWLGSMQQGLGIRNHYRNVAEHGSDRWFNALGARRFSANACVVVSCGTAVTIDALTDDNHYLGGTIMPGFHLMKEAMAQKTANLNRPIGRVYPFPTTTANALASGMMDAVCGSILLMHGRLQARSSGAVDLVLTGGGAAKVAQALPAAFSLDNNVKIIDNLVIYGLLNWIEQT